MKPPLALLTISMLLVARLAPAQYALRNSMSGDAIASSQRLQQLSSDYTYKAGDFRSQVAPSLDVQWIDNVNLTQTNKESDFIIQPALQLTGKYPLTQRNLLSLSVGIAYAYYLRDSTNSGLRITSSSGLSFDVFIKDVRINFHDYFSLAEDASTEPAAAGTSQYGTFANTAGLNANWDLEDIVLTLGYDHQNSLPVSGQFTYLGSSADLFVARAGLHLRPDLTAGLEASASFTTYDQAVLNNNESYSGGVYADWLPGSTFHLLPRVGYVIEPFQHTSQSAHVFFFGKAPTATSIETSDLNTWYADLTLSHSISQDIIYGLSAGRETRPGIQSDAIEDSYASAHITWKIIKDVGLNSFFSYQYGNEGVGNVMGNLVETYSYYSAGLSVSYQVMKKIALALSYRVDFRSADVAGQAYTQNQVGLHLSYQL
jgi:hypothetical protein